MSVRSKSSSGSVASSTNSAKEVDMNEVSKTSEKKMRIVGVNGCTSMHLFGAHFIVGAHADSNQIPIIARRAADSAGEGVTSFVVWAPDADDLNRAVTELSVRYPQARIFPHLYAIDKSDKGEWSFEATQGNPGAVSAKFDV